MPPTKLFIIFIFAICLIQYVYGGQIEKKPHFTIPGVIFTATQTDSVKKVLRATGAWTPTEKQIMELEAILPVYILTYNGPEADFVFDNLSRYKRQYLGIHRDGEKLIYVNGICEERWKKSEWQTRFIRSTSRDKHSFYVYYNPQLERFWPLIVQTGK
jgi:hypothetical protein